MLLNLKKNISPWRTFRLFSIHTVPEEPHGTAAGHFPRLEKALPTIRGTSGMTELLKTLEANRTRVDRRASTTNRPSSEQQNTNHRSNGNDEEPESALS